MVIKKIISKKIILILAISFSLFLIYLTPNKQFSFKQELVYLDDVKEVIYLLDKNNYVARTEISINEKKIENKAKKLLDALIEGKNDKIPSGFKTIIPSDTKINSLSFDNNLIKVDVTPALNDFNDTLKTFKKLEDTGDVKTNIRNLFLPSRKKKE